MKKHLILVAAAAVMLVSCGGALGNIGSAVLNNVLTDGQGTTQNTQATQSNTSDGGLLGNVLNSVLGATGVTKLTQKSLIGTWKYNQPGCAFTSDDLLAQAGGEVVAGQVKQKLQPTFQTLGIKSGNTSISFKEDGTFSAKIAGKSWSGSYTFYEKTAEVNMKGLLLNMTCYAKQNANGIGLLFEANKLLTLLQTLTALSGNSTLSTIGDLSKNYKGLRLGFDYTK